VTGEPRRSVIRYCLRSTTTGRHGTAAIDFYRRAFGAEELGDRFTGPNAELIHAEIGERGGRLRDPFGQQWMMSQHIEDVSPEEMSRRAAALFGM